MNEKAKEFYEGCKIKGFYNIVIISNAKENPASVSYNAYKTGKEAKNFIFNELGNSLMVKNGVFAVDLGLTKCSEFFDNNLGIMYSLLPLDFFLNYIETDFMNSLIKLHKESKNSMSIEEIKEFLSESE